MVESSLSELRASSRHSANRIANELGCRVESTLEQIVTLAPLSASEEEAEGKVAPAIALLVEKYYGFGGAKSFKVSEGDVFYAVGRTESGTPRLLIFAAVFRTAINEVRGDIQDSSRLEIFAAGYSSIVGIYTLKPNGSGPASPHKPSDT